MTEDQIVVWLTNAHALTTAEQEIRRLMRNPPPGVDIPSRNAVLEITRKLILAERDSCIDTLVQWWATYRGGK